VDTKFRKQDGQAELEFYNRSQETRANNVF